VTFSWTLSSALLVALSLRHALAELAGVDASRTAPAHSEVPAAPPASATSAAAASPAPLATTRLSHVGPLEVVELGLDATSLGSALADHLHEARRGQRAMLVLVTEDVECPPCRGLDDALRDARVQEALGRVRLVRVSRAVFKEELAALGWQTDVLPMLLRLDEGLTLLDAIHGGEWDADIPENIAPVLGAFARGSYRERRHPRWTPVRRSQRI